MRLLFSFFIFMQLISGSAEANCKKWKTVGKGNQRESNGSDYTSKNSDVPLFQSSNVKGLTSVLDYTLSECEVWDDSLLKAQEKENQLLKEQNSLLEKYHQSMTRNLLDKKVERDQQETLKNLLIEMKKLTKE